MITGIMLPSGGKERSVYSLHSYISSHTANITAGLGKAAPDNVPREKSQIKSQDTQGEISRDSLAGE